MFTIRDIRRPTLEQTYINLNEVLQMAALDCSRIKRAVNSCPEDAFDISVKLIIIDRLQLYEELKDCLFSIQKSVVGRAVKCSWFFKLASNSFFIENLLPVVSVSTRLQVISALAKCIEDSRVEELYDFAKKQFGATSAEPLLARCRKEQIRKVAVLEKRHIKPKTFITICRRFPDVGFEIGKVWTAKKWHIPEKVGCFLATNHPDLLKGLSLHDMKSFGVKMGRKLYRKYMKINGDQMMNFGWQAFELTLNTVKRLKYFTPEARVRSLVQILQERSLTWEEMVQQYVAGYLVKLPAQEREFLLQSTFKEAFGEDLWEKPNAWSPVLLEMITPNCRSRLLDRPQCQGDKYLHLHPPVIAIPKLIILVKRTSSSYERSELLRKMIHSCRLTWDLEQLQIVCAFAEDFLHDDVFALRGLLLVIHKKFCSLKLPGPTWIALSGMVRRLISHGYTEKQLLFAHEGLFSYCLANNENFEEAIHSWITDFSLVFDCAMYENMFEIPCVSHRRNFLRHVYPHLLKIAKQSSDNQFEMLVLYKFLENSYLVSLDFSDLPDKGEHLAKAIFNLENVSTVILTMAWKQKLHCYLSSPKLYVSSPHLIDILKVAPHLVKDNFSEIFDSMIEHGYSKDLRRFLQSKCLLAFYNLNDNLINLCANALAEPQSPYHLERILFVYSHVAPFHDYLEHVKPYLTIQPKVNPSNPNARLIIAVPGQFINIKPISDCLPYVLPCLKGGGDLFYPALPAFLCYCYTMPVSNVLPVITSLLNEGVSVQKKVLPLIREICSSDIALKYYRDIWPRSKHISHRLGVLACISRCFLDNPCPHTWRNLQACLLDCDGSLFPSIPSVDDIQDDFLADFAQSVWGILTTVKNFETKRNFLSGLANRIHILPEKFCRTVILYSLFDHNSFVDYFTVIYLIRGNGQITGKLNFILTLFLERCAHNSKSVVEFVDKLCSQRTSNGFRPIFNEFLKKFGRYLVGPIYLDSLLQMKNIELCEMAENGDSWKFEFLPTVGQSICSYWLTIPDYYLLSPLFSLSLTKVFRSNGPLEAVLAGLLCNDPALCLTVLTSLPKIYVESTLLSEDTTLDLTDWTKDPRHISVACQQYIIRYLQNVSEPIVQHSLCKIFLDNSKKNVRGRV